MTTDVGQHQMWAAQHYPLKSSRTLFNSRGPGDRVLAPAAPYQWLFPIMHHHLYSRYEVSMNSCEQFIYYKSSKKAAISNSSISGVRQWQKIFMDPSQHMAGNPDFVRLRGYEP